jgi:hypothetical protein
MADGHLLGITAAIILGMTVGMILGIMVVTTAIMVIGDGVLLITIPLGILLGAITMVTMDGTVLATMRIVVVVVPVGVVREYLIIDILVAHTIAT